MSTIVDEIKEVLIDASVFEIADDVGADYIVVGCNNDFWRSQKRIAIYRSAEAEYIKKHKKEILKLAAKLCRDSIGDITELITIKTKG